jgi:hypothetical protein
MVNEFVVLANSPWRMGLYMFMKLPAAWFSGVRLRKIDATSASVSIQYKWLTQNPFRSIYFASLAMAAEFSTGVLALAAVWGLKPGVSMLVIGMDARFTKKAVGRIVFCCDQAADFHATVAKAIECQTGETLLARTVGRDEVGDVVAEFNFIWTFKQKSH